jgi:phosphate:Na+ symporter
MQLASALIGGVGLFLLGMILLTDGLKAAAGDALRRLLTNFTGGPLKALLSGAGITALVQSSSATTLATIGFVSAGLLTFPQAVGVVFGANLGTTTTGWIVSLLGLKLQLSMLALPMVGAGVLLKLATGGRRASLGLAVAGFGLLFVGIDVLQGGMRDLAGRLDPAGLPGDTLSGRLLLVAIGAAMTVVMQSSSAALATTLAALGAGTIDLHHGAALVIGQNLGTTVTAAIAALGASVPAKRTAVAHIGFNLITGAVALAVLPLLLAAIGFVRDDPGGPATLAAFHTVINLLGVALLFPFIDRFAGAITRLVPERVALVTRNLDASVAAVPAVAVEATRRTLLEILALAVEAARPSSDRAGTDRHAAPAGVRASRPGAHRDAPLRHDRRPALRFAVRPRRVPLAVSRPRSSRPACRRLRGTGGGRCPPPASAQGGARHADARPRQRARLAEARDRSSPGRDARQAVHGTG